MGFFSWNCHACGNSVRAYAKVNGREDEWMCHAAVAFESGTTYRGIYTGYGEVYLGEDLYLQEHHDAVMNGREKAHVDLLDAEDGCRNRFTIWHDSCWVMNGNYLLKFVCQSDSAEDQGWFVQHGPPDPKPKATITVKDYQTSYDIQNASNIIPVLRELAKVTERILKSRKNSSEDLRNHPLIIMYSSKLQSMTHSDDLTVFGRAYEAVMSVLERQKVPGQ